MRAPPRGGLEARLPSQFMHQPLARPGAQPAQVAVSPMPQSQLASAFRPERGPPPSCLRTRSVPIGGQPAVWCLARGSAVRPERRQQTRPGNAPLPKAVARARGAHVLPGVAASGAGQRLRQLGKLTLERRPPVRAPRHRFSRRVPCGPQLGVPSSPSGTPPRPRSSGRSDGWVARGQGSAANGSAGLAREQQGAPSPGLTARLPTERFPPLPWRES